MSIILRRGMLLADKLYRPGDTLPDTEDARILAERGDAEIIEAPAAQLPQEPARTKKTKPVPEPRPNTQESDSADGTGNP